jgi:glycerophosphoryl diester phosphodiesterase
MLMIVILLALIVVYFWLLMPRMRGRPDYAAFLGRHYAHRGLHDNDSPAPENSMAAFRKAVEAGYGIEFDVQLTKDRIPVVFHDETLDRVCGISGKVRDFAFDELQEFHLCKSEEKIPKLSDFLDMVAGQVPLIIEIKIHEDVDVVCAAADEVIRKYQGVYCVESFHPMVVRWYRKHRPEVLRGQLSSDFSKPEKRETFGQALVHYLLTNVTCRPDFIAYHHEHRKNLSRLICKALFRPINVTWVVRSQEELDACRDDFEMFIFENFIPKD